MPATMRFDASAVRAFRFVSYGFDEAAMTARLDYAFDDGSHRFTEEVTFAGGSMPADEAGRAALDRCLRHLHLVAGISYYKAALSPEAPSSETRAPEIVVETGGLAASTASFLDKLYLLGLGELAYKNDLDLRGRIRFPARDAVEARPVPLALPRRTAVPVGGGKDSVVTIEALKTAGEPMVLFSVGDYAPIRETARVAGVERLVVSRRISPALLELNERGAINGHVPISAIIAFLLATSAVLYGFDAAALSNERSADEANLSWKGQSINHQYSKSSEFERDFGELNEREMLPGFRYFSFLRPLSEVAIAAAFSRVTRGYHEVFRSCNTAFRLDEPRRGRRWCRDCPKCRFVFLALAPFLARDELIRIFGGNLLDDPAQEQGFADLLEIGGHKPFECVGEVEECRAALAHLAASPGWRDDAVIKRLRPRVSPARPLGEHLSPASLETLPDRYRQMLPRIPPPRSPA